MNKDTALLYFLVDKHINTLCCDFLVANLRHDGKRLNNVDVTNNPGEYRPSHVYECPDLNPNVSNRQTTRASNVYSLADNLEDHTYHELSGPRQSGLSSTVQQNRNTDGSNYYHTLTDDDLDGAPSATPPHGGK